MTFTSSQIEIITQSVLRELRSRGVAVAAAGTAKPTPDTGSPSVTTSTGITLSSKVITEDLLAAANAAGQTLNVPRGAIITPSGHEYIRRNGITISSNGTATCDPNGGVLISAGNMPAAASAADTAKWQIVDAGCEFDAAKKAKSNLPKPIVCCVAEPSVTACLLNRDSNVRAAVITQQTDIQILGNIMNPQVVCLNSVGWSFTDLLRLLRQLSTSGSNNPSGWKEIVGGHG